MKAQIAAYAKSTDEADLVLPSALSSDERKQLHEYIDRFELQHSSIGAGTDRRLVVSRFRPFAAVSPAQAEVIIGSQVWKDPPAQAAGEGTRGHIISYDRSEARWLLQYPNSDEPDEHVGARTERQARAAPGQIPLPLARSSRPETMPSPSARDHALAWPNGAPTARPSARDHALAWPNGAPVWLNGHARAAEWSLGLARRLGSSGSPPLLPIPGPI